ncbi:MAG: helix-turn-helix domain-containing protein [bacterium]
MSKQPSIDALAAAYLTGEGWTQEAIARRLDCSQPTVSRLVAAAERAGHLRREAFWVSGDLDDATLHAVRTRAGRQQLREALETIQRTRVPNLPLPTVAVFPSGSRDDSKDAYRERLKRFGTAAGAELLKILNRARVCGVCWGKSVAASVQGVDLAVSRRAGERRPVTFIPICGEQVGIQPPKVSASMLASQLSEIWNNDRRAARSLMGIPAFVPSKLGPDGAEAVWKYVRSIPSYQDVFGGGAERPSQRGLIHRMDTVLVSVSLPGVAFGLGYGKQFRDMAGVDGKRLSQLVGADIGGALIPKPTLSATDVEELAQVSSRWTGIQLRQLQQCAEAARKNPKLPGVVVIAIGASKAETVRRVLLDYRLVNHLICDDDLEERLIALLGNPTEPARAA